MIALRRHGQADYVAHLSSLPLFSECSRAELKNLARRTTDINAAPGQVLIREGQGAYDFFVVVSGEAEVTRGGEVVAHLIDGDYFGELGVLDPGRRDATVIARTPMELVVLPQWDFEQTLEECPAMTRRLLAGMAHRLRTLDQRPLVNTRGQ